MVYGASPIRPVLRPRDLPLSFPQEVIWFMERLWIDNFTSSDSVHSIPAIYNIPVFLRLRGPLNVTALQQSINEIVRRHEVLRSTVVMRDGLPIQVIAPALSVTMEVMNLCDVAEAERESEAHRLASEEADTPFDIAQGPLFRVKLLRLSKCDHVVLFNTHHIVFDGWSVGVLMHEFTTLYEAYCNDKPSPLPELGIQYVDFTIWQRQWLHGEVMESLHSYWKQQTGDGLPVLKLPSDCVLPEVQTFRGSNQSLLLSKNLSEALKTFSLREKVSLFITLLATFNVLLHQYTGQDDIVVGSAATGRNWPEVERLIGHFGNNMFLRTDLSGNPSFRELLKQIRELAIGAYKHQHLSYHLLKKLHPGRDLVRTRLDQVAFNMLPGKANEIMLSGLKVEHLATDRHKWLGADVRLHARELNDGIQLRLEYRIDLFEDATISRMLARLQALLEKISVNPELRLSDLLDES